MNLLLALAVWLLEHLSRSANRHALCGDLLQQRQSGRSAAWLTREVLTALGIALTERFGRLTLPILFSATWSTLYRGYFLPEVSAAFNAAGTLLDTFLFQPLTHLLLQIAPVMAFLWFGLAIFAVVRRDVLRNLSASALFLAFSTSHAFLMLMVIAWPKHGGANASIGTLLTDSNFYLGWINLPLTISLLVAIVCVLPHDPDPPRRRRRDRARLRLPVLGAPFKPTARAGV